MPKLINLLAYDLIDKIIAYIHEHHLTPGTKLPSERDLSEMFNVNRTTLRGALQKLVDNGTLRAQTNSGYYLTAPKFEKNAHHFFTPIEDSLLSKQRLQLKATALSPKKAAALCPELNDFKQQQPQAYLEYIDAEAISLMLLIPMETLKKSNFSDNPFQDFKSLAYTRSQEISLITDNDVAADLLGVDKEAVLLFVREEIRAGKELAAIALGYTISRRCNIQVNVATTLQSGSVAKF